MRVIQFADYGPPEMLQAAERDRPEPGQGAVLVKVEAAGVNPADVKWRAGMFRAHRPLDLPHVPGYDLAGTVAAIGSGVTGLAVGDRVFAMLDNLVMGAYADYAVAPAAILAAMDGALDFVTAAALPTAALTGVQMIEEHVRPGPGQRVLVTGATGGVGRFALFAAKAAGTQVVAAVRASQRDEARALGADSIIILGEEDWTGAPFDHVADTVGGPDVASLCRHVADGGSICTVSTTAIDPQGLPAAPVFFAVHPDAARLEAIGHSVAHGAITMPVARRLPLDQAAEAHRLVEAGGLGGRVVLTL
jgi:NADPH2:quinone reductase